MILDAIDGWDDYPRRIFDREATIRGIAEARATATTGGYHTEVVIMLFRMGQCLNVCFKQVREAEGYYRGSEGSTLHRRSLEKDDQWARSRCWLRVRPQQPRGQCRPGPALLRILLGHESDRLEEAEVHYREAITPEVIRVRVGPQRSPRTGNSRVRLPKKTVTTRS